MAFKITLGICKDPKNKISKTMEESKEFNCAIKSDDGVNIINPTVLISNSDILRYNYAYIPSFNRYYYISSIDILNNNVYQVNLDEDVLMSWRIDIRNSKVKLSRSFDYRNYYLKDNLLPVTNQKITSTLTFKNSPFDGKTHGAIATIIGTN